MKHADDQAELIEGLGIFMPIGVEVITILLEHKKRETPELSDSEALERASALFAEAAGELAGVHEALASALGLTGEEGAA